MKILAYDEARCVGCGVCEETCSEAWFKVTDAARSSIRVHDEGQGALRATFCVQCGDCIDVCPSGALSRDKRGVVRVDKKLCVGCLSCVGFCPISAMFFAEEQSVPFKCVACGRCTRECPADALAIVDA